MKKITLQFIVSTFFLFFSNVVLFAQASFTTNLNQGCAPLAVTFTNTTPGTHSYQFSWFFQDGSSTLVDTLTFNQSVTHNYTVVGNFNPSAFVYDITTGTSLGYINGNNINVNGVSINSPDSVCQNEIVGFSPNSNGSVNNTSWDFGDITSGAANTSTQQNPQHTYSAIGTYVVTLVANTSSCGQKTVTKTIYVSNASYPHPHFWTNPSPACPNAPVSFNINSFATYSWNFGDPGSGAANISTLQNPTHSYPIAGKYYTTLTVTNICGHSGTTSDTIRISNNPKFPNGMGIANQNPVCPGQQVNCYVYANTTYPKYVWDFGDGTPKDSTGSSVNHIFNTTTFPTIYTLSCKITNYCGPDSTFHNTVTVTNHAPFPNYPSFTLQVNSSPSCPNSSVNFNAPGGYNHYVWKFGDGSDSATTTNNYYNHTYGVTETNYPVSVRITNACGNDTILYSTVTLDSSAHFPNQSWFQLKANTPSCPNSGVYFEAPGGFSNYIWNFGDSTSQITSTNGSYTHMYGSAIRNYVTSVIITNGCGNDTTLYATVQIMANIGFPNSSNFQLNVSSNPVCHGDQMNWNAPQGYSNYKWKFGDGDSVLSSNYYANHTYVNTGSFNASVKITNSCGKDTTLYSSVIVDTSGSFSSWVQIEATPSISCQNDMIAFSINQNNFQSYTWNFGDGQTATSTGNNIQHAYDTIGNYIVSCQVTNGCSNHATITTSVQVSNSSPVNGEVNVKATQNPSCKNDEVFFIINQGQSNYTYVWNYGDISPIDTTIGTGAHHTYATNGTYTVTILVINGCGSTKTITMTETISDGVTPSLTDSQGNKIWGFPGSDHNGISSTAGCSGDAIIFYFMGSAANNVWNFGDGNSGTATESMMIYGKPEDGAMPMTIIKHAFAADSTYLISLTITNSCGISITDTMSIKIENNQTVNGDMATSPPPFTTCASIDFLAFGGSTYGWNFGDGNTITTSSPTVSHTFASQGVYVVSVLVTNGCGNTATYSRSVNVNGVGGPAITLSSSVPPTCVNGTNGSATISVTSGQPPYIYSWNTPGAQTTATATGLSPGLYNATVTDNIGCASTFAVSISNPAPIVLNVSTTTTGCGTATGTASVTVTSGGTGVFTYLWSTGETSSTETALAAGAYSVVATDVNGCTSTANASISESGGAVLSINSVTNNLCYGSSTGAIDINVTGGIFPFTYVWSNAATTQDITGLAAGSYSVQVTDFSGCKAMLNATITQPSDIVVATSAVNSPTCGPPPFNGSAKATANGGTGPYTYLWDANAASQTNDTASALPAGTYTVTVTDFKGCTKDGVISLNNSNAPSISAVVADVSCNGLGNGSINVTVSGGTSSYYYTWNVASPQTHHEDLNSLFPGNYLLHLVDAKQCESYGSYTISQPAVLTTTVTNTGSTCSNTDGTATALPTGGNTSYTYSWTGGGQTAQTATGLALGGYTVTVTDNKGCTATGNTTIAATTLPTEICMVSVDALSTHNVIYWEKPVVTNIDSFKIYREDVTNVYTHIGSVAYDSLSEYHDYGVNPNTTTKRYKISTLDNCGQESVKSNYHNTIYIVDNGSGQFTWNPLYTIENTANPVNNYVLMRDDNSTGTWVQVTNTAGTQNTLVDPAYASYSNGNWRVETAWGISCTPTRATINTTRSNIKHQSVLIGINSLEGLGATIIYPNPATDYVSVEFMESIQNATIRILNSIGQLVYEQTVASTGNTKTIKQIKTNSFAKGIYTVVIENNKAKTYKKLVIN